MPKKKTKENKFRCLFGSLLLSDLHSWTLECLTFKKHKIELQECSLVHISRPSHYKPQYSLVHHFWNIKNIQLFTTTITQECVHQATCEGIVIFSISGGSYLNCSVRLCSTLTVMMWLCLRWIMAHLENPVIVGVAFIPDKAICFDRPLEAACACKLQHSLMCDCALHSKERPLQQDTGCN